MFEIFGVGIFTIMIIFCILLWFENKANRKNEFMSVKDWHNFRNAMNKKEEN